MAESHKIDVMDGTRAGAMPVELVKRVFCFCKEKKSVTAIFSAAPILHQLTLQRHAHHCPHLLLRGSSNRRQDSFLRDFNVDGRLALEAKSRGLGGKIGGNAGCRRSKMHANKSPLHPKEIKKRAYPNTMALLIAFAQLQQRYSENDGQLYQL